MEDPRDDAVWREIQTLAGRPASVATSTRLLRDPDEAWQRRLELINGAERSICTTMYHVDADEHGLAYLDALIAAARRGVNVILGLDSLAERVGNMLHCSAEQVRAFDERLHALERAGGIVTWYGETAATSRLTASGTHFKSLIVDGETAVIGGRNIADLYFGPWHDCDMELHGPVVSDIADAAFHVLGQSDPMIGRDPAAPPLSFEEYGRRVMSWQRDVMNNLRHERVRLFNAREAGDTSSYPSFTVINHDPNTDPGPNRITESLLRLIDHAEHRIVLSSVFFRGTGGIPEALIRAAERGVQITILTSSEEGTAATGSLPYLNAEASYGALLAAGIEIRETSHTDHAKLYLFDDRIAAIGSYNIEQPAHDRLMEQLLVTRDPSVVAEIRGELEESIAHNSRRYEDIHRSRSWWDEVVRTVETGAAILLGPFM